MVERSRGRPNKNAVVVLSDERLLDAVLQAFGEDGFDGASIREIARSLNVSHNLIPQRFGAKKRLWYAAIDHGFGRMTEELVRAGESMGEDDLLLLRGLVARFIEIHAANPALLQIINQEASRPGPRMDYLFETFIKPVRDFGEPWLSRLAEQGRIRPTSVTLMYFMMTHGAGGLFAMPALAAQLQGGTDNKGPLSVEAQAAMAVSIIFDGILPRGS